MADKIIAVVKPIVLTDAQKIDIKSARTVDEIKAITIIPDAEIQNVDGFLGRIKSLENISLEDTQTIITHYKDLIINKIEGK